MRPNLDRDRDRDRRLQDNPESMIDDILSTFHTWVVTVPVPNIQDRHQSYKYNLVY